jgi:hypothetical protein
VTGFGFSIGNPSLPATTAGDRADGRQPNSRPLGYDTGAPPRTQFLQVNVTPRVNALGVLQAPTLIVPATPENRFVTITAPAIAFAVLLNPSAIFTPAGSFMLPPGLPYETSLPGLEELYAVTTSPVFVALQIQLAPAIAADTQRRLGRLGT